LHTKVPSIDIFESDSYSKKDEYSLPNTIYLPRSCKIKKVNDVVEGRGGGLETETRATIQKCQGRK
jgi:hypothetical protein